MRWLIGGWVAPVSFLLLWLGLASNDWSFGVHFFSRAMYDEVFGVYGNLLGLAPETVPPMVVRAILLDSCVVVALFAFRRRTQILNFAGRTWQRYRSRLAPASTDNLSSAP